MCVVKSAGDPRGGCRVCRQLLKSDGKPVWLRCNRIKPPCDAPRMTHRCPKQSGDFCDFLPVEPPAFLEPVLHRMDQEREPRQLLAQSVVQIAPQPSLLALDDVEDFPLQAAQ